MKGKHILLALGIVILIIVGGTLTSYNSLVAKDEAVATALGNVKVQYQRRADLVPNLVSTVKAYAKHESETFASVVEARAKAMQVTGDTSALTPQKVRQIETAQGRLSQAISRIVAVSESYPELKASENFSELQAQLEGTENRIGESRRSYNEAVRDYNVSVRSFPGNIVAGMFGFGTRTPFESEAGTENAPKVEF